MAVERTNKSRQIRESLWLYCPEDPFARINEHMSEFQRAEWPYALPGGAGSNEGDAAFTLGDLRPVVRPERSMHFSWTCARGTRLPSLAGTITASRFGPFVNLTVRATYRYESSIAGRLAHEALGSRCATTSLQCLLQLLQALFPTAVATRQRATVSGRKTSRAQRASRDFE